MPRASQPAPQCMRLSRETLRILDEVAEDLGLNSRKDSLEIIVRHLKRVRLSTTGSYADVLLSDQPAPSAAQCIP